MSRCFPYPPPGYSRNGATYEALIESIKLQKENDKAKAERKKEKRAKKEKKDKKEKRKGEEKSKLKNNNTNESQQDSQKSLLTPSLNFKESHNKKSTDHPTIEHHLEKSDITEEHGQPVDSHKPSYSSDSTQNSNKRKREDPVIPDDDSNHAKPIFKIRLLKKQKGPDSVQETSRRSEQQSHSTSENIVPFGQSTSNSLNGHIKGDRDNRSTVVPPVTSGRENMSVDDPQVRKQSTSISGRQILPSSRIVPPVPPQSKKSDVAVVISSRQQQPTTTHRRPSGHELPTPSPIVPPVPSVSGRMSIDEIKAPVNKEKKVGPTRFEKKLMKKHSKYEKLIGCWVPPPVVEAQVDGEDDWLLGGGKTTSARSAMVDDVETCRESMWQPCARFLVEADLYAMPYTVPF